MANLLRLISLLKNDAWTSKNSISTKASNFQIFLKKNGLPTKILKLGTTLSSNQPTKAVLWSFGAPTFTNKKLLDNWPTLNSMQRSTKISHKLIKKLSKTPLTNSFWKKNCPQQPAIFSSPRLKHLHFTSNRKSTNLTTPVARSFLPAVAQQNSFPAFERFIGFVNSFHPAPQIHMGNL